MSLNKTREKNHDVRSLLIFVSVDHVINDIGINILFNIRITNKYIVQYMYY